MKQACKYKAPHDDQGHTLILVVVLFGGLENEKTSVRQFASLWVRFNPDVCDGHAYQLADTVQRQLHRSQNTV